MKNKTPRKFLYEHHSSPLLPTAKFILRLAKHGLLSFCLVTISLSIGIAGYHYLEKLDWIESLLNASMILGGMGPVDTLQTNAGKIFASCYALFSGVAFIAIMGILLAPFAHRIMHRFHIADDET